MSSDLFETNEKPTLTPGGKVRYGRPLEEFARMYGQSDRTIKRWIRTGKEAKTGPDLPPLDVAGEMPAWWARHYKHRCPAEILEAAARSRPAAAPAPAAATRPAPPVEDFIGTGFEDMLRRVREAEAEASREYLRSMAANPEDPRIPALRKTWQELTKQLRELERDAHEILSRSGQVAQKSVVESVLAEIHGTIVLGVNSLWPRLKARLRTADDSESDAIWRDAVNGLFRRLNESDFLAHE